MTDETHKRRTIDQWQRADWREEADQLLNGWVRWDGYINMHWQDNSIHLCGPDDLDNFRTALDRAFTLCMERMGRDRYGERNT